MRLNSEFTPVVKKNSRAVKTNATFYLIEELLAEKNALIINSGYKCTSLQNDSSKAFIFEINTPPDHLHFETEGFVFVERHLRVDKLYSLPNSIKGQSGFAAAHYTENYRNPQTHETITIHLYYANTSQYVQIRKNIGPDNIVWLEDIVIDKSVQYNAFEAIAFYKNLIAEKNNRYISALRAADQAEKNIKKMWRAMPNNQQIQLYINAIDDFCLLIDKVNLYNELERDCSDTLMRTVQQSLRKKINTGPEPEISSAPAEATIAETIEVAQATSDATVVAPKAKTQHVNVIPPSDTEYSAITNLATTLKRYVTNITPITLVEATRVVSDLTLKLLLYTVPKKSKKKADQKKQQTLKEIEALMTNLPDLCQYATAYALRGDLEAIQTLFPILNFHIQYQLFNNVLDKLTADETDDSSELANKLRALCAFFYEHSIYYKTFVEVRSGLMKANTITKSGFSILISAALAKKFSTFAMLVDHGMDVDGLSYFQADLTFTHLKAVTVLNCGAAYIIKLLEKGATIDAPKTKLSGYAKQSVLTKNSIENFLSRPEKFGSASAEEAYLALQAATYAGDLSLACGNHLFEVIPAFLNKISLPSAVHALAQCVNLKIFTKRLIPYSKKGGIFFCKSKDEAEILTKEIFVKATEALNVAMICYLTDGTAISSLPQICLLRDYIKEECQKNYAKLPKMILAFETQAEKAPQKDRNIFYIACQMFYATFIHDDKSIDIEINLQINREYRQRLMRCCCLHGSSLEKKKSEHAYIPYYEATLLAQCDEALQTTPIYLHAQKKLASKRPSSFGFLVTMGNQNKSDDKSEIPKLGQ